MVCVLRARVRRQSKRVGVALPARQSEVSRGRKLPEYFESQEDLPDVNFGTATTVWPDARIGIICRGGPAFHVGLDCFVSTYVDQSRDQNNGNGKGPSHLATNKLQVASTLSVTVADTILGASLVVGLLGHATVLRRVNNDASLA